MIVLPGRVRAAILERARGGSPEEVCGILGGEYDPERSRVASQYPAENAAEDPRTRYGIDPEQQLAIFERLEDRDEEIVGFYHSHPRGPAGPSATDAAHATWPDRSYVIASLEPLEVGSWRWRTGGDGADAPGDRFEREELVVE